MIRLLADENLDLAIVNGLIRVLPSVDFVRVQDVGLSGMSDPIILAWAADENRVLVTHDLKTIPDFAYKRVSDGLPMPGVIGIRRLTPLGSAISDLHLMVECSTPEELKNMVYRIPIA